MTLAFFLLIIWLYHFFAVSLQTFFIISISIFIKFYAKVILFFLIWIM